MPVDLRSVRAVVRLRFLFLLDAGLLIAFVPLQTPRGTGMAAHEWIGIALAAMVTIHLLVNWRWITGTLRRVIAPGSRRARINLLLNGALFLLMALIVLSGLAISEVVLPLAGFQPSILRAWRQIHSLCATLSVVIVGFHLALNWDWIAGAVRSRLRVGGAGSSTPVPQEVEDPSQGRDNKADLRSHSTMKALGFPDFATIVRRLGALVLAIIATWAFCFLLVKSSASVTIRDNEAVAAGPSRPGQRTRQLPPRERIWPTPNLRTLPREVGTQLVVVFAAAVVGRKLLRLRL